MCDDIGSETEDTMTEYWLTTAGWLGHALLVGAAVLLLGLVGGRLTAGPARRQRLAAWAVRAAVLAPLLCLLPTWMTVTVPSFAGEPSGPPVNEVLPDPPEAEAPAPMAGDELALVEVAPEWLEVYLLDEAAATGSGLPEEIPADDLPEQSAAETPVPLPALPGPTPPEPGPSPLAEAVPLLVAVYALVVAILAGQMLLGQVGLARLVWRARPATGRARELFEEMTAGWRGGPRLLVSDRLTSPVCFGLVRPTVLLPAALARAGTESELRWVFAHELDHVRRGDLATGWWVGLARALYFAVPWFWPLRRDLDLAQEYLADAAAAAADGRSVDYAAFLVELSDGPARLPRMAHAVRAGGSDLYRRVTMLLKSGAGLDRRCPRGWGLLAAGGVLSAAVLLSGLGIATAQDKDKEKPPPEKRAEKDRPDREKPDAVKPEAREKPRGDRPREGARPGPDVGAIKKAIDKAARDGNFEEMNRQIGRLEQALRSRGPRDGDRPRGDRPRDGDTPRDPNKLRDPERPAPPVPPRPPFPPGFGGDQFRFNAPNAEQMKEAMEQAERSLKEALEGLQDNPEAKKQLERAMEAFRKGMEEGSKRAAEAQERFRELRRRNPDALPPGFGGFGGFGPPEGFGGGMGFGRGGSPRFGVIVSPVTEALAEQLDLQKDTGVVVMQVIPGSAAEKAGVKKNDIVVAFAGQEIGGDVSKFAGAVEKTKPGEKVEVVVLRKGKKETLKGVQLPEAPKRERRRGGDFGFDVPEGAKVEKMSVRITDGEFDIDATRDGTAFRITGRVEEGKPVPSKISVDGKSFKSLEEVPEEHRDAVKELLGSVRGK